MVVGAGRGPLVRRALSAAQSANVTQSLTLIALEKNPGAIQMYVRLIIISYFLSTKWAVIKGCGLFLIVFWGGVGYACFLKNIRLFI